MAFDFEFHHVTAFHCTIMSGTSAEYPHLKPQNILQRLNPSVKSHTAYSKYYVNSVTVC